MKNMVKAGARYAGILVGSILVGTLLLLLVYAVPTDPMKANVRRSTEIYDYEGVYPQLMWGYKMSQLDNCTDATMLLNAIYGGEQGLIERAMQVYRTEYSDEHQVKSLTNFANDERRKPTMLLILGTGMAIWCCSSPSCCASPTTTCGC